MSNEHLKELSSPIARGKRLRYIRKEMLDVSRRKFAERHKDLIDKDTGLPKITEDSLHNWEAARFKGLTEEGAIYLIEAFKRENLICEKYWLLDGVGNQPTFSGFRNILSSNSQEQENEKFTREFNVFRESHPDAIKAIITDESLSPWYKPGDWVAGVQYWGKDIKKAIGAPCIAETEAGEIVVKKLTAGESFDTFSLATTNPHYQDKDASKCINIHLRYAAPIIWWRRSLSKA